MKVNNCIRNMRSRVVVLHSGQQSFWPDRSSLKKSTTPISSCEFSTRFVFPHPEHFPRYRNFSQSHFVFPLNFNLCSHQEVGSCGLLILISGKHCLSINPNVFKCFLQWPKPQHTDSICFTSTAWILTRTSAYCRYLFNSTDQTSPSH